MARTYGNIDRIITLKEKDGMTEYKMEDRIGNQTRITN